MNAWMHDYVTMIHNTTGRLGYIMMELRVKALPYGKY
jgi:hypothetical protein